MTELSAIAPVAARSLPWLAVGGAGALSASLTPIPGVMYGASVGAGMLGLASSAHGLRTEERSEMRAAATVAVDELLGRTGAARVRTTSWRGGWVGSPSTVRVDYTQTLAKTGEWIPKLAGVLERHLGARYKVVSHSVRKQQVKLRVLPGQAITEAAPRVIARVEKAVTTLMGASARLIDPAVEDGQLVRFTVAHEEPQRFAVAGARHRIETTISTMMPGRWRAVWDLEQDTVRLEVRPTLPDSIWLPAEVPDNLDDLLANYRKVRIPYAVDEDGVVHEWAPATLPQVMLTGSTGSGKTSLAHTLLGKITQYGWPVWVLDAKRVEFLKFRDWPNVQIVAGSIQEQVALVHRVCELMDYRYRLIEDNKASSDDFEPLVVFLDEFAEFRARLLEWYPRVRVTGQGGDPAKPATLTEAQSLARLARTARIHLVLSTQRPDVDLLGSGEMRDNFGLRTSMGRLSPNGALMMWENPRVGVSLPRGIIGRAMSTGPDGRPVEVQCYRFPSFNAEPDSEEAARLEAIRPATSRHPRLVIIPPEPTTVIGKEDEVIEIPPTFGDYVNAKWALMSDHPELDPLHPSRAGGLATTAQERRKLASTTTYLGLESSDHDLDEVDADGHEYPTAGRQELMDPPSVDEVLAYEEPAFDEFEGYGEAEPALPWDAEIGDLLQDGDRWVVVDEDPIEDPADPSLVAISWRDDADEAGSLAIDPSDPIFLRRPVEDASAL